MKELYYFRGGYYENNGHATPLFIKQLGIYDYIKDIENVTLTDNLKGFSGEIKTQLAFIFRLVYIRQIKEIFNLNLPIIIDSPRHSELKREHAEDMLKILNREFGQNQIIVASIFKYKENNNLEILEIKDNPLNNSFIDTNE